ncbi:MAG: hypothetical protein M3552_03420 [Planctomycetota bacterium]|nr:hypothetical protein [Planctomycetaceae bacterium]MDQ3329692.1 hypothetical protein [Planctomycetota bacterium]
MKSAVVSVALLVLSCGCGYIKRVDSLQDQKAEPTLRFWARLQGVEHRARPEMRRLNAASRDAVSRSNVDETAGAMLAIAEAHGRFADQLEQLDSTDVDDEAAQYRGRLAKAHRELADAYRRTSKATVDRDEKAIKANQPKLKQALDAYEATWNDRGAVMTQLGERYAKDFDVKE